MVPKAQSIAHGKAGNNNWDDAKKLLSEDEQKVFGFAQTEKKNWKDLLQDVLQATDQRKIELFEREKKASFSFRGKQIVLRDVLSKLAVWTNRFKDVGDAVVQYDPGHAALPWAIVRLLLEIPVKEEETYGAAMEGVERAAEIISRCAILEELYLTEDSEISKRLRKSIVELYAAVLSFLSKAVNYFNSSAREKILKSFFTTKGAETWFATMNAKQEEVEKNRVLADAQRAKDTSELMHTTNALQEKSAFESKQREEKLKGMLEDFGAEMSKVNVQLADLRNHLEADQQRKILESISKILHRSQHADLSKGRLASSGQWLLEKSEFRGWQEGSSSSILWLRGIPGSGKTKLTSLVVDSMQDQNLAFFYCVRNPAEPERAMAQPILASLVEQLACADKKTVFDTIRLRYLEAIDGSERYEDVTWDIEESTRALIDLASFHESTVLVLDALDEMEQYEVSDLLEALIEIMRESRGVVKIFFSSRDSGEINDQLEDYPSLRIDAQDNSKDIEDFVHEKLHLVRGLKGTRRAALREEATRTLINGSQGMFRWVELQIQMLRGLVDPRDIKAKLGHLPKSLEQSYHEIFGQIKQLGENAEKLATTTFQWLLCAQAKVRLDTFAALASTDLDDSDEPYTEDGILRVCLNLVVEDKDGTFRFAHLSVREFLE
ncbi:uncharacterized protein IWZ02DRAFT_387461, partial [Phyllosticta citriasiana]|uniref:uncharacterized protein n=1 Tax=Phyllosticta citriasiana TaxID=595635 RepID=UPI0030FD5C6E